MDKIKLAEDLKDKVVLSYDSKDPYDSDSWGQVEGVLISRRQAELFIKLLECEGKPPQKSESNCAIPVVIESVCPKAKHDIMALNNKYKYCPDCGEKLW